MQETAIQAGPPAAIITPAPTPQPRKNEESLVRKLLKPIASLRLTVWLFALSILLIFFGTLAQVDAGIWTVVNHYFRSWGLIWVPFQIFVPRDVPVGGGFPYPGGWLLGGLLLVNLIAAHAVRFRISWKRSGILLIHSGLIVMMLGELFTGLWAVESRMTLGTNESANFIENSRANELAIIDRSDPKKEKVVVIPDAMLRDQKLIQGAELPFDIAVDEFYINSALVGVRPEDRNAPDVLPASNLLYYKVVHRSEETGVDQNAREDIPVARVTFRKKGSDEKIAALTLSSWFYPNTIQRLFRFPDQQVTVDGKSYVVELRPQRIYKPYTIQLLEFTHERYPGTDTPKNFQSRIRLIDPERKEDREVKIYMNNPLRHGGETFYQSGFLEGDQGTVLQVVRNPGLLIPGWLLPYISCAMVVIGLLIHFGVMLVNFLQKRLAV